MENYRAHYHRLPETEKLDHVTMKNDSTPIDYDQAVQHIVDSEDHLRERGKRMMERATGETR